MLGVLVAGQNATSTIQGETTLEINEKGGFTQRNISLDALEAVYTKFFCI